MRRDPGSRGRSGARPSGRHDGGWHGPHKRRSADQLARIEQAGGIEACLHPAQRRQASGAVELGEQVAFQLSDAVFGRDRSPEFKDMAVDEAAGILAMRGQPRRTVHALGRLDMVMDVARSEEHTSELQSLMRISYAVFCLKTN